MFRRFRRPGSPAGAADPLQLPPAPTHAVPRDSVRGLLGWTWPGRVLIGTLAVRLALAAWEAMAGQSSVSFAIGRVLAVLLAVLLLWFAWRLWGVARRHLLWRVRRKLILSYIFIGVVPALLIVSFFLFVGLQLFFHISAFLFKRGIDDLVEQARIVAEGAAGEIQRAGPRSSAEEVLERKVANNEGRYAGVSMAVVRRAGAKAAGTPPPATAGSWRHAEPPDQVPAWVGVSGFGGWLPFTSADDPEQTQLVIRAVAFPESRDPGWAVVVDVPLDERIVSDLREATGIELQSARVISVGELASGRSREAVVPGVRPASRTAGSRWTFSSVSFYDFVDWATGSTGTLSMGIRVNIRDIYERISAAQSRFGGWTLGELFITVLGVVAVLFLIIEAVALVMGFALARSITGSVHALFEGTERVRAGDYAHRVPIRTRDQMGDLAESFNHMTADIEVLLRQKREKERLEEELRIAREIQMSLLPRGTMDVPGLSMTALCVPAREVGGDYYDFFRLGPQRLGLLIADVAGKGTSAALYMAELKGLVLSLSTIYESPKQLLIEVNRIISDNLDSRSFITMTYAVLDLDERTLTYARAGHTPLIHFSAGEGGGARLLAPSGLVVGLRIEGVAAKFEALLDECRIPLVPGDVVVLYTDGITEAMNASSDMFGEERLQALVETHGDLPCDQLRERILREVEAFVGGADQHDDMTMILIKIDGPVAVAHAAIAAASAAAR